LGYKNAVTKCFGVIDLKNEQTIWEDGPRSRYAYVGALNCLSIAFSPDERYFAICDIEHSQIYPYKNNFIGILDIATRKIIRILEEPREQMLHEIAFSSDGNSLFALTKIEFSGLYHYFVSTWDVQTGELVHRTTQPIKSKSKIRLPVNHF
jgi:WD40 repeat protein